MSNFAFLKHTFCKRNTYLVKSERTSALQGLRVLFILSIIFGHAGCYFLGEGAELCSFFFVISGFLFAGKQVQIYPYIKGKLIKLYPVYLMFLLVHLIIAYYYSGPSCIDWKIAPHILLLQSYYPRFQPTNYLGPAWFLSSIMFCWYCVPTLSRLLEKLSHIRIIFMLCSLMPLYIVQFTPHVTNLAPDWQWEDYITYISPILRMMEFTMGLLLGFMIKNTEYKQSWWLTEIMVFVVYIVCIYFQLLKNLTTFAHLLVIAYCFCYHSPLVNKVLGNSMMQKFAKYSMYFYLGHYPFVTLIKNKENLSSLTAVTISIVAVSILTWGYLVVKKRLGKRTK